jgi:Bifunctional DNA primase/polymerase, N-terminal
VPASSSQPNPRASFDAALRYAERGWHVFPVERRGKRPVTAHGLHDASSDVATVSSWWASYPAANVGIRTGNVSSLVVVDVDGETGMSSIKALIAEHGRFPAAWVRTGSGGWHAYFAHPVLEIRNSAGKLGAGLDVRGDGGYVVAPPSIHPCGGTYQWHAGEPGHLDQLPRWVIDRLRPTEPERPAARPLRPALSPYVVAAIEREALAVANAGAGERNDRLNRAAFSLGQLVGAGTVDQLTIEDVLLAASTEAGLPRIEAQRTIRSGLDAGQRQPRVMTS